MSNHDPYSDSASNACLQHSPVYKLRWRSETDGYTLLPRGCLRVHGGLVGGKEGIHGDEPNFPRGF